MCKCDIDSQMIKIKVTCCDCWMLIAVQPAAVCETVNHLMRPLVIRKNAISSFRMSDFIYLQFVQSPINVWPSIFVFLDPDHTFAQTHDLVHSDSLCLGTDSNWSVGFDRIRWAPIFRWIGRFRRTAPWLRYFLVNRWKSNQNSIETLSQFSKESIPTRCHNIMLWI